MTATHSPYKSANISNEAVKARTGKTWTEWYELFDAAGAVKMTHREIVAIASRHEAGSWWQQMVTVGYEQARGLREKNMSCEGTYQVNVTKTLNAPVEVVFEAWNDPVRRIEWLPGADLTIRKATPAKSLRITWNPGENLDVNLFAKGDCKCTCSAEHSKFKNPADVERLRSFWSDALNRLKSQVEA